MAARSLAPLGLVGLLAMIAIGLRVALSPWVGTAGLVLFLPFVAIAAYLAGPRWGYLTLVIDVFAIWYFVLPPHQSFALPSVATVLDLALLILASIGAIEFVRRLQSAFDGLELEQQRYAQLAEQRRTLMNELTHRTSNNFQMVSSILGLARRTVTDAAAKRAIGEASERVAAMALVQRQLSQDIGNGIDLATFLPTLCAELERALGIRVSFQPDQLSRVSSRTASSLALIVQEFVANAAEHATIDGQLLNVTVRTERRGEGRAALIVEDDGRGIPLGFNAHAGTSLGLTLVDSFLKGMGGNFDIHARAGAAGAVAVAEFALSE